jgi:hypothetical protein
VVLVNLHEALLPSGAERDAYAHFLVPLAPSRQEQVRDVGASD